MKSSMRVFFLALLSLPLLSSVPLLDKPIDIHVDAHGCIFNTSAWGIITYLYKREKKAEFFSFLLFNGFSVTKDFLRERKNNRVAEKVFDTIAPRHPGLDAYRDDFIALSNQQKVNAPMIALLKYLQQQGHHLVLTSNIGPDTLADLENHGSAEIKDALALFKDRIVPTKENGFLHKPQDAFFEKMKDIALQSNRSVLYIDDKESFLEKARSIFGTDISLVGMHPYQFVKTMGKVIASSAQASLWQRVKNFAIFGK
jgi:FMN phosphatase YigB (HAD superfamily)